MPRARARTAAAPIAAALLLAAAATALGGAAQRADRNRDHIPDRWERAHRLSLKVDQSKRDQDRDGLTNRYEYLSGTNPRKRDSDRDGRGDGAEDRDRDGLSNAAEQRLGTLPNNGDSDRDGTPDGLEVVGEPGNVQGAVVRFDAAAGVLVVNPQGEAVAREVVVTGSTVRERIGTQGLIEGLPVSVDYVLTESGRLQATRITGPEPAAAVGAKADPGDRRSWRRFCRGRSEDAWTRYWKRYWSERRDGGDGSDWDRHWNTHWRSRVARRVSDRERHHGRRHGRKWSRGDARSRKAGAGKSRRNEGRGRKR